MVNPGYDDMERADINLVIAGTRDAIIMVEGGANEADEASMLDCFDLAQREIVKIVDCIEDLRKAAGVPKMAFAPEPELDAAIVKHMDKGKRALVKALATPGKHDRSAALKVARDALIEKLVASEEDSAVVASKTAVAKDAWGKLVRKVMRDQVIADHKRLDGRPPDGIRGIWCDVGLAPRAHGSAVFTRGETQAFVTIALGTDIDSQRMEMPQGRHDRTWMLTYNFPPFCTGEARPLRAPKRREVGHGALARRALIAVLPKKDQFPYVMRSTSEVLESNGSSSMATVCGTTLAMLDAGVPLKAPVAGIAMGLISDEVDGKTTYVTLTDILGAEDAYGDMDFKVAGTRDFVTALQLDTKLDGIPSDVLAGALQQAHDARQTILDVMERAISGPAPMSEYAPRVTTIRIPVDKIGMVIGPKGQTINAIQDETGADITIEDDGTIYVGATDGPSAAAAVERINAIANPTQPKVGEIFLGTVVKTAPFGAFISLLPGRDGLLHISKVGDGKRVERVEDYLNVGDKVEVRIADIDGRGKIYLDKADAEPDTRADRPAGRERDERGPRDRGDRERGESGPRRDGEGGPRRDGEGGGEGGRRRRQRRS
jgi:polyribonucleotide nucleotidyltransferase